MTICKYFLQGTCRFGDNCKFEHQVNSEHNYANSTSVLLNTYANKPSQTTSNVDTNTLVKAVVNDMTSAEKGGQWLLSSYAPFKDKPAFPGFEDHSMEEIRYLFYEAMRSGTVEQYKQNLQLMLQRAVMKIKALQNPSPDAVNMLKTIYNTSPASSFGNNANTVFGGSQSQQKSVFGGTTQNQSAFGGSGGSSVFNNNQNQTQQSIFGGTNSIFASGQSNTNSIFGGQSNADKSIFGNSPPQANNNRMFANMPTTGQSIFANPQHQQTPFTQNTPFNQQMQQQQQQQQYNTARAPQQQQNIFQQNTNQFDVRHLLSNQFGPSQAGQFRQNPTASAPENKSAFQHSANIFGNLTNLNPVFATSTNTVAPKPNEDYYSKIEELTEDDIKWFQSDDLDINTIPEKPPTYEMCFKVH